MARKKTTGIYQILNTINGKVYVGSSKWIEQRWRSHLSLLRKDKHHSKHMQNAWNLYGEDAFQWIVLEECFIDDLAKKEQSHIDGLGVCDREVGYNTSPIANSQQGHKWTDEQRDGARDRMNTRYEKQEEREKTGAASKAAWTEDRKEEARVTMLNKWSDPEERMKQSVRMQAIANDPNIAKKRHIGMKKRWANPEEIHKARFSSPNAKRIQHCETGIIYESISDAARNLPVCAQTIKNNLNGKCESFKGMNFTYVKQ